MPAAPSLRRRSPPAGSLRDRPHRGAPARRRRRDRGGHRPGGARARCRAAPARLRAELERRTRTRLAVVVADTMGRALRRGIVGTAIGASGLDALRSYAGTVDPAGYELRTTGVAVADELAAAADLVLGKLDR